MREKQEQQAELSSQESWNQRYAEREQVWSGHPNDTLVQVVSTYRTAGQVGSSSGQPTAVDLGCGEGADAIWLARQGWTVSGVDISDLAIDRARAAARVAGVDIDFVCADLSSWVSNRQFDLIVSSFLQSHTGDLNRAAIFKNALEYLTVGGLLVSVSHAGIPSFATADDPPPRPCFPTTGSG